MAMHNERISFHELQAHLDEVEKERFVAMNRRELSDIVSGFTLIKSAGHIDMSREGLEQSVDMVCAYRFDQSSDEIQWAYDYIMDHLTR